jgi:hypothetical protein
MALTTKVFADKQRFIRAIQKQTIERDLNGIEKLNREVLVALYQSFLIRIGTNSEQDAGSYPSTSECGSPFPTLVEDTDKGDWQQKQQRLLR